MPIADFGLTEARSKQDQMLITNRRIRPKYKHWLMKYKRWARALVLGEYKKNEKTIFIEDFVEI